MPRNPPVSGLPDREPRADGPARKPLLCRRCPCRPWRRTPAPAGASSGGVAEGVSDTARATAASPPRSVGAHCETRCGAARRRERREVRTVRTRGRQLPQQSTELRARAHASIGPPLHQRTGALRAAHRERTAVAARALREAGPRTCRGPCRRRRRAGATRSCEGFVATRGSTRTCPRRSPRRATSDNSL